MPRDRILAIVQAGGAGGRMDVLTRERAKPALPFAGVYQLIDLPLSNLVNSGISDVWLSVQFQGGTLEEQVANGRPWDLDRTHGGLRLLMPEQGTGSVEDDGFARGNADELYRIRDQVRAAEPDIVIVLSADHVYRFDFSDAIATHRDSGAECTVVVTEVELEEASEHATVAHDDAGRVTDFVYKPDQPATGLVAAEIFVYDPEVLVTVLEDLHRELQGAAEADDAAEGAADGGAGEDAADTALGDFGEHLLPRLVDRGKTVVHRLPGYWRDLGRPETYLRAHLDVLTDDLGVLDDPTWSIRTRQTPRVAARVLAGAEVVDSLVSPGSRVAGRVVRSVIGPGSVVAAGAVVRHSVVFSDTVVEAGAVVDGAVVDSGCVIGTGAVVGRPEGRVPDSSGEITLVGRGSTVGPGVRLAAGARLEPGTTA